MKSLPRLFTVSIISFLFIMLFPGAIFAQASPLNTKIEAIASQDFPQVQAFISVTDSQGFSITGLEAAAFSLSEDNHPVPSFEVTPFRNENQPLAIVLVIDVSGSMAGKPLTNSVAAAKDFIATLTPNDQVALIAFSNEPSVVNELTTNHSEITQSLDGLKAEGDTAHYDAIVEATNLLKNRSERRVIVSLTDGKESGISKFDFNAVIDEAVRWSTPVYPIGFGSVNQDELERLAKLTGGFAQVEPDSTALTEAFQNVVNNLRQQYLIKYVSDLQADGLEHEFNVKISHLGGVATTSEKFIAHPGQVTVSLPGFVDGQSVSGKILFEPSVLSPAPISRFDISIDDQPLTSILEEPFSHVWDSSVVAEGEHIFKLTVTDAAGNSGSQVVTLNVQAPIRITPGLAQDQVVSGEVLVAADVIAPAGIAKVNFYIDDQSLAEVVAPPYETVWDTRSVSPGYHTLRITGADLNGFTTEAQVRVNVEIQSSSNLLWVAIIVAVAAAGILIPLAISRNKAKKKVKTTSLDAAAEIPSQKGLKAVLIEKEGMNPGMSWQLGANEIRIGRKRDENDIPLKGLKASRRQALIRYQPEGYILYSLVPENPMIVNGMPVTDQVLLNPGDILQAGESQFIFEVLA